MNRKKTFFQAAGLLFLLVFSQLIFPANAFGDPPDWEHPPGFQYNMQVIAFLELPDGTYSQNQDDMVAAFVDGELRGVESPLDFGIPQYDGQIFLTIASNSVSGEWITFKAYLADEDVIVDLDQAFEFQNLLQVGTMDDPFIFSFTEEEPETYTLTLVANPEEGGEVFGAGDYEEGEEVLVNAIPNMGWEFVNWTDPDDNIISDVPENIIPMPGEDLTLIANFEMEEMVFLEIPYFNAFRTFGDLDDAFDDGFTIEDYELVEAAGGYLKIFLGGFVETPTIDFTALEEIQVDFSTATFGAGTDRKLDLQISTDNGITYTTIFTSEPVGSSPYLEHEVVIDLTDIYNVPDGRLRFIMSDGTGQIRFRDLGIAPYEEPVTYTLTLIASPEEGGEVTGAGEYEEGEEVLVNAIPNEGWVFVNWTDPDDNLVSEDPENLITMPGEDLTLIANFEIDETVTYTLTLIANPEEGGEVTGAGEYEEGDEVLVNAIPNEGWVFVNWTDPDDNLVSEDPENLITMPGEDLTLIANFVAVDIITLVPFTTAFEIEDNWDNPGGAWGSYNEKNYTEGGWFFHSTESVRGTGDENFEGSPYSFRDRGIFTVTNLGEFENMTGFSFQLRDWMTGDGVDRPIMLSFDGGDTWETVMIINQEWFDEPLVYQPFQYFFTAGPQSLDAGELVIEIGGGTGANDSRINIGQFQALEMDAPDLYTLTLIANPEEGGEVTGAGEYEEGEEVLVNAIPNEGWVFVNWTDPDDNLVSEQPENLITMPGEDLTLIANFEMEVVETYTLTLIANPEEGGEVTGAGEYEEGEEVLVNAIPSEGWVFVNWTDPDDNLVSEQPENLITMPGEDLTLIANFEMDVVETYTLTLIANPEEGGEVTGAGEYEEGEEVLVNAIPNMGWVFVNWTDPDDNIVSDQPENLITMPAEDLTLIANFEMDDVEPIIVGFPFFEDFEDPDTYNNWIILDLVTNGFVWQLGSDPVFDVQEPMEGNYAWADSDAAGSGNDVWTILQAPIIDLENYMGGPLTLSFDHHYRHLSNSEAKVLVSNDGQTWETVVSYTSDQGSSSGFPRVVNPVSESIILDGFDTGDMLYLRFEYNDGGSWAWYWLVDNIKVDVGEEPPETFMLTLIANPEEGGMVTGAGTYEEGEEVLVNAIPNAGWVFVNWTDLDDNIVSEMPENLITMPGEDLTLIANFEEVELPVVDFPFFEDFEDPDTYDNWSIFDQAGEGFLWGLGENDKFNLSEPMEGKFAWADSDEAGSGNDVWTILQAPVIDLANFNTKGQLFLSFDHHYRHLGSSEAKVLVSNDGETWETLVSYTSDQGESTGFSGPFDVTPVSEFLLLEGFGPEDMLYIRFEYNDGGSWAWYWLLDNIKVDAEEEEPDMIVNITVEGVSCPDADDGSIFVEMIGAKPFNICLQYGCDPEGDKEFSNVKSQTAYFGGLVGGYWLITVMDADGNTYEECVLVPEPEPLFVEVETTDVTCFGYEDGTALITVTGGTPPYTLDGVEFEGNAILVEDLGAGEYFHMVDDANLCGPVEFSFEIEEPEELIATVDYDEILCYGGTTDITVSAEGGTGMYSLYDVSGDEPVFVDNFETSITLPDQLAGMYYWLVKDENECEFELTFEVEEPEELTAYVEYDDILCYGETTDITVFAEGGTGMYSLYDVSGDEPVFVDNFDVSITLPDLPAGMYYWLVKDENDCEFALTFEVEEPDPLMVTLEYDEVVCFGETTDVIVTAEGGTGMYSLYDVAGDEPVFVGEFAVSITVENVGPGTYSWLVKDVNECEFPVDFTITEAEEILITNVEVTDVLCAGEATGEIIVYAEGGDGELMYSIDGENYQASNVFENLYAGTYTVYVMDEAGCMAYLEGVVIDEPAPLDVLLTWTHVTCYGADDGTITGVITGGVGPYSNCLLTGCPDDPLEGDFDPVKAQGFLHFGLETGFYTITVTDQNGCVFTQCVEIEGPEEPLLAEIIIYTDNKSIPFEATVYASGGSPAYEYLWESGKTSQTIEVDGPGWYAVTVTDYYGCQVTDEVNIPETDFVTGIDDNLLNQGDELVTMRIYPNPMQYESTIFFELREGSHVKLDIYNLIGEKVVVLFEGYVEAGQPMEIKFRADGMPKGMYFYRLETREKTYLNKLIIIQ